MKKNKQLTINLVSNIIAFIVTMGINFFLTPFIVKRLGNEAYGYIGLANNFISFASLFTIAINSMAGRFIGIEIHNKRDDKANVYYNSVLVSNFIIAFVISLLSIYSILNLSDLINISSYLTADVQLTFGLLSLNFLISTLASIFNVSFFVKNRLDLQSLRKIGSSIIKVIVMILLFIFLPTKIYYVAVATLFSTIFLIISNYFLAKKLLPEIKINVRKFKLDAVKELLSSGIWNAINSLSTILLTGLDLLIANLFISSEAMGILSIAKTIPNAVKTLTGTIAEVFTPNYLESYAKGKIETLLNEVNLSIKILSFLLIVPLGGFIVFGTEFYTLWLPNKSIEEIATIQILSILTILPTIFNAFIEGLYGVNRVTNKIKTSVLVTMGLSTITIIIVFILLKTTSFGVYAIAGVSSVFITLRVLIFAPMYAAYILNVKLSTFYPALLKSVFCLFMTIVIYFFINNFFIINTWIKFITIVLIAGAIGYVFNFIFIFSKKDRNYVINIILRRLKLFNN